MNFKKSISISLIFFAVIITTLISCTQEELEQFIPTQATLLTPTNNELDVNKTPHFSWEPSTDNNGDDNLITYDVYLWTANHPETLIAENLSETTLNAYPNNLMSLTTGETYFWKVISVDQSSNEASSETWSFTVTECPTLTFDGKTYITIKIGNHRWLKQNLNSASHPIGHSTCYDDENINCAIRGRLYDWYAAMNIAEQIPGWHLSSDEEWKDLERALGMDESEIDYSGVHRGVNQGIGTQLKIGGTSGFEARNGGYAAHNFATDEYTYLSLNERASFWTSTEKPNSIYVYFRNLKTVSEGIGRYGGDKEFLKSVRLVKD
ncbi:FISUMP domain-containing protein [Lacinutrix sp. Bg11-31]|uniref:FISUMP domain-containing protein n=1 Tax=Lacinutrix sp. Bg11-31 TaxID=2057808 RepID=UPI000C31AC02|nr:FISUMP domain-containing protein [Lacinutrix sp. Bg11-31]AUC80897.1 hypothetical protein CW733_01600 [Lacinutrix sp. Bg11-31]